MFVPQPIGEPQAIVTRHAKVAERDRRRRGGHQFESLVGAGRHRNRIATRLEPAPHQVSNTGLVVDDDRPERFRSPAGGGAAALLDRPGVTRRGPPSHASSSADVPAAGDRPREVEPLEATIEGATAQAEHLRRGLLVAARPHKRALDVIAFDVDQQIGTGLVGRGRTTGTGDRGRRGSAPAAGRRPARARSRTRHRPGCRRAR